MPATLTYPGVYIEEIPSGVRTITGVATSIAAFIDFFKRGPIDKAVQILNFGDFERIFGGLDSRSEASYGIQQFFLNGGTQAWVVRVASGTVAAATVQISDAIGGGSTLTLEAGSGKAANPGAWGNDLRVSIDDPSPVSGGRFNMTVLLVDNQGGQEVVVRSEVFRGLSMNVADENFVRSVINDEFSGSKLVRVIGTPGANRPLQTGTLSGELKTFPLAITDSQPELSVTIGGEGQATATLTLPASLNSLSDARGPLEAAIRAAKPASKAFSQARVTVVDDRLRIQAGPSNSDSVITFSGTVGDATTVTELKLAAPDVLPNLQLYSLGRKVAAVPPATLPPSTAQGVVIKGEEGDPPNATAIIGDFTTKTGINALEDADLFNILCLPRASMVTGQNHLSKTEASTVIAVATAYCERRRAFFIIDTPSDVDDPQEIKGWLEQNGSLRHKNAAVYFPRVQIADPLDGFRLRSVGASGTVAGLYSRTDTNRGVWKAPAGIEATLANVQKYDYLLTDGENGTLNPLGINCLRNFKVFGNVSWGARTLEGADQLGSEWKYVPIRRIALFLEESLYRGTQFAVFEPNDEPLWSQIRLNVGAFMQNLFRQGAFQGKTPREAYFVKCDKETTTQNDVDLGIVNILVGFAPLKPAEFVVIKLQQIAGQIQT